MSRHHSWQYATPERTPELDAKFDALYDCPHPAGLTCKVLEGGSSGPEGTHVWLWANKTKARRLTAALDVYFGVQGTLTNLDVEDDED